MSLGVPIQPITDRRWKRCSTCGARVAQQRSTCFDCGFHAFGSIVINPRFGRHCWWSWVYRLEQVYGWLLAAIARVMVVAAAATLILKKVLDWAWA